MNDPRLKAPALSVLVLFCCAAAVTASYQQRTQKKVNAPETATDSTFEPKAMDKVAVVVAGETTRSGLAAMRGEALTNLQRRVEDEFVETLVRKGYTVVSRSDIQAVLKEQKFQKSGLTEDNAAEVGKILNVPAVLVVHITECSTESQRNAKTQKSVTVAHAAVGARLVNVQSGTIWWTGKHSGSGVVGGKGELPEALLSVADKLANAFPDKNPPEEPKDPKKAVKKSTSTAR